MPRYESPATNYFDNSIFSGWVTSTSTSASSTSSDIFRGWVVLSLTSGSTTTINDGVFSSWVGNTVRWSANNHYVTTHRKVSHLAMYKQRKSAAKRETQQFLTQLAKRKARVTAEQLLREHLTPGQNRDLNRFGFFKLYVGDKVYRIRRGIAQNIDLVREVPGKADELIRTLCAHTYETEALPAADEMLMQKLFLQCNEEQFLKIANQMGPVPGAHQANQRMSRILGADGRPMRQAA